MNVVKYRYKLLMTCIHAHIVYSRFKLHYAQKEFAAEIYIFYFVKNYIFCCKSILIQVIVRQRRHCHKIKCFVIFAAYAVLDYKGKSPRVGNIQLQNNFVYHSIEMYIVALN